MESNPVYVDPPWEEIHNGIAVTLRAGTNHALITGNISYLFSCYLTEKEPEFLPHGTGVWFTEKDCFLPDGMVLCTQDKIKSDAVYGAPDLVAEVISSASAGKDRGYKKAVYEESGVREYWIISPGDRTVEQYFLQNGRFVLQEVYADHPDWMLAKMSEEERAAVITEFKCSLFDDLLISVADIFDRVI